MSKKPCFRGHGKEHGMAKNMAKNMTENMAKNMTENMANRSKHGSNLNDSNFTKVINHFEGNCIGKSLF